MTKMFSLWANSVNWARYGEMINDSLSLLEFDRGQFYCVNNSGSFQWSFSQNFLNTSTIVEMKDDLIWWATLANSTDFYYGALDVNGVLQFRH